MRDDTGRTIWDWVGWFAARGGNRGTNFVQWVRQFQRDQADERRREEQSRMLETFQAIGDQGGTYIYEDVGRLIGGYLPREKECEECGVIHEEEEE